MGEGQQDMREQRGRETEVGRETGGRDVREGHGIHFSQIASNDVQYFSNVLYDALSLLPSFSNRISMPSSPSLSNTSYCLPHFVNINKIRFM